MIAVPPQERTARLVKRSFTLAGHRTSVALEHEFWSALDHIAATRRQTLSALVAQADAARTNGQPLASALRLVVLRAFRPAALNVDHIASSGA
jgi:predicted DNA-binding ribbon-helix-helix protein